jgi:hypothetical protein
MYSARAPIFASFLTSEYYLHVVQEPLEQDEHPDLDEEAGTDKPPRWSELVAKVEKSLFTFLPLQ